MVPPVTLESGFAEVGAGAWLVGRAQPAACFGETVRRRRKGWIVRDRAKLDLVETTGAAKCAEASRPFLTHIPCAAPIAAVSDKVLVAPATARTGAENVRLIPFSSKGAICVTKFGQPEPADEPTSRRADEKSDNQTVEQSNNPTAVPSNRQTTQPSNSPSAWVVMATASRTARVLVAEGETLSVRPESAVAWTGRRPSGYCPKLGVLDLLRPRGPKNLLLRFHGPCIVWLEGAGKRAETPVNPFARRVV